MVATSQKDDEKYFISWIHLFYFSLFVFFNPENHLLFRIQAVSLNGLEAVFYSNQSACYMELGNPEKALEQAQIALMIR